MKRTSFAALTLLVTLTTFAAPGCSSDNPPDGNSGGSGNHTSAGTGNSAAGTPAVIVTAGTSNSSAGTAAGGSPSTAGASSGGTAGAATGGAVTGGATTGGAATGGSTGGGGAATGGAANPGCPEKIDSKLACTMVISCPKATCGVFKLGSKDCDCAAAAGTFTCSSCTYTGTDSIVVPPAAALPACAADDVTLEKNTKGCTKGDRCKSLDTTKSRFCACWDDPVDGGTSWDCDAKPSNWP